MLSHQPFYATIFAIFAALAASLPRASADDATPPLVADPKRLYVEVGTESSEVQCTFSGNNSVVYKYLWTDSKHMRLNETENSRIFFNATTGLLTLNDARENDTGFYYCYVFPNCDEPNFDNCTNAEFEYKVYEMPDYTTDGIIIGVINGVLLIVFIACLIRSAVVDRRRLRKYGQKL